MIPESFWANFAVEVAGNLASSLIDASARAIKRKFVTDAQKKAVELALANGLNYALASLRLDDAASRDHYQALFKEFLLREQVIDELTQLLDPRPDATLNLTLLRDEFAAAGYEPDSLGFDFDNFMRRFFTAFYDAAAKQKELQGAIAIGLLRGLVERTGAVVAVMERAAEATEFIADELVEHRDLLQRMVDKQITANEISTAARQAIQQGFQKQYQLLEALETGAKKAGIEIEGSVSGNVSSGNDNIVIHKQTINQIDPAAIQQLQKEMVRLREAITGHTPTPEEIDALERRYCAHVIRWFDRLTFGGMMRTAKAISLPLEEVYVELRAVAEVPELADAFSVEERRLLLEKEDGDSESRRELMLQLDTFRRERWSRTIPERKSISETLYGSDTRAFVILGDPGSGKSTLLYLMALVFAKGSETAQKLLSVPPHEADRLPIYVPFAAFDDMLRQSPNLTLVEFLARYYDRRRGLPGLAPLFQRALESGKALILLDGLDEVLDVAMRSFVSQQANAMIGEWTNRGVRFAVTSRFVGYREAPLSGDLPHLSILDFGGREIERFVHRWTLAYEKWGAGGIDSPETIRLARDAERNLLDEVRSNTSVGRLAANPLMLTMLALLRRQVGKLPHRRILLYERYINTLIENWVEARAPGARAREVEMFDLHQLESMLIPFSLWLLREKPSGTASKAEIRQELKRIYLREAGITFETATRPQERDAEANAERFLREMREMTGLIIERGQDAYGFLHLTFQEYFAGRALARMSDESRWAVVQPQLHSPRWREPIMLCAGQLGVVEKRREQATEFAQQILNCEDDTEEDLRRNLLLALSIAGDDVNFEPTLLVELIARAENCLPTNVYAFAVELMASLGQLAANGVMGIGNCLTKALEDDDEKLRLAAVQGLTPFVTAPEVRIAVRAKLDDSDGYVRRAAVEAVSRLLENDSEMRAAVRANLDDADWQVRLVAVSAVSGLLKEDSELCTMVRSKLDDAESDVRRAAIRSLSFFLDNADIRSALKLKLLDNNASVRETAVVVLANIIDEDTEAKSQVIGLLKDPDKHVRISVIYALSPIAFEENVALSILDLQTDDDDVVRQEVQRIFDRLIKSRLDLSPAILNSLGSRALIEKAKRFFEQANFSIIPGTDPSRFILSPRSVQVYAGGTENLYVSVIAAHPPSGEDFQLIADSLHETISPHLNRTMALVVCGQRPERGATYRLYEIREKYGIVIVPISSILFSQISSDRLAQHILSGEIDQAIGHQNLFSDISMPVVNDLSFFGRERIMQDIKRLIAKGQPIGIFGLRKAGKTSLIQRLQARLSLNRPISYIDTQLAVGEQGVCSFYFAIINAFATHWKTFHPEENILNLNLLNNSDMPLEQTADMFIQDLKTIYENRKRIGKNERLLIIVDEIDRVIPGDSTNPYKGASTFLAQLRAANQSLRILDFIVVGVNPAINTLAQWGGHDNEMYHSLRELWIPPMEPGTVVAKSESI